MSEQTRHDEDLAVLWQMRVNGGGFASALAEAAYRADAVNLAKIKATWPDLWLKYSALANLKKSKERA